MSPSSNASCPLSSSPAPIVYKADRLPCPTACRECPRTQGQVPTNPARRGRSVARQERERAADPFLVSFSDRIDRVRSVRLFPGNLRCLTSLWSVASEYSDLPPVRPPSSDGHASL